MARNDKCSAGGCYTPGHKSWNIRHDKVAIDVDRYQTKVWEFGSKWVVGNFWTGWLYDGGMKIGGVFLLNAGLVAAVGLVVWIAGLGRERN